MIYFDRKTVFILWCIKRSKNRGITWEELEEKYGQEAANPILLESLSEELYTVTQDENGNWVNFKFNKNANSKFRSFSTPKGNELVEQKLFDFWKWIIPTVISVAALIVSVLSA